jgi:hypothetical protein
MANKGLTRSTLRWTTLFACGEKRVGKIDKRKKKKFPHPLCGEAAERVDKRSDVGVSR